VWDCAGLDEVDDQVEKLSSHVLDRRLVQVVIARNSDLIGKTVRETKFRNRFDAAMVALHREGHRQRKQIGDIQLAVRFQSLFTVPVVRIQRHHSWNM
jgi:Trk K+ transport system NAD-binding subunit